MTNPVLQLKVSRLRHNKFFPDRGDYFQVQCNNDIKIFQLINRIDGMLYANLIGSPVHLRFNPYTLEASQGVFNFEIYNAERMPSAMQTYLNSMPIGCNKLDLLRKWFKLTEPYINTFNEFL